MTQEQLALQIGCATVTLRKIEYEERRPSVQIVERLMEIFNVPQNEKTAFMRFTRGSDWTTIAGESGIQAPWLTSVKPKHNLPAQISTFIGRKKEQSDVINLITNHRLVTLVGTGGIGKTRLSIQVASELLNEYPNGAWIVELAPLTDLALVTQAVCTALDVTPKGNTPVLTALTNYLISKKLLLVVDNCEHLLDECAHLIDALLKNCPHLKILATSREPFGITGEAIYLVPSLELPDLQRLIYSFRDFESVRLFEERAQLIQFDFSLTPENISYVVQICRHLDGIPLAIELAAAKGGTLSTEQIAKQLDESFNVLTGGSRTALPRHQTLRASMNWSWGLLTGAEQTLMRQLTVFAGGWTLEAAQAVCGNDVFQLINSLIQKSLIVMNREVGGETRYRFHETIRQYAEEKLLEAGGSEVIHDSHLAYFVKLAEQAEPELYHSNQVFWLNKLDDELDNLRAALKWALTTAVESGLRIIVFTWLFWRTRSYNLEIGKWLAQLLERYNTPDSLRVRSSIIYCRCVSDLARSRIIAEQCLELARTLSDKQAEAYSLLNLGEFISLEGNLREGISFVEQSLTLFQALDDKFGQANATSSLSMNNNDLELSKSYVLESLRLHRELGHLWGIADCLVLLTLRTIWGGDFSGPARWLEEAYMIYRQLEDQSGEAWALAYYGILAFWMGDYQQACTYDEEAVTLHEKLGNYMDALWSRVNMAYALLRQRNIPQAKEMFELCIQRFQKANNTIGLVYAIEGLASLNVNQGQSECAARLFAWSNTVREKIGDHRPPIEQDSVERDLAVLHFNLNDTEFANLSAEGRAMTMEQAIVYALENSNA